MKKPFLFSAAALLLLTGAASPESPEYTVSKHHNGPELYYCYADTAGNRLNDVRYAEAHPFCGDRALVREMKKYGYIGPAGELAIPYRFDAALNFGDLGFDKDLAVVRFASATNSAIHNPVDVRRQRNGADKPPGRSRYAPL